MDKLKELLGDLYDQVVTKLGDTKIIIDDGKLIPKHRLDETLETNKSLKAQIEQNDKDLKDLKERASGNQALSDEITKLQRANKAANDEFVANEAKIKKTFAVKEALMNAGVGDPEARALLLNRFDLTKVELDEAGKPKGFDELLKPIKENKTLSSLFGETKIIGQDHNKGGEPGAYYTRDQVVGMSQAEVQANLEKVNKSMETWK